jgi:hypothetical protein
MAAFVKFEAFSEHLAEGVHNLDTGTLKVLLSNDAPSAAGDAVKADLTSELGTAGGYTSGGADAQNATSRSGGVTSVTGVDIVWTETGAGIGPFRYAVLYNDTPTSPADPLIGYWDYGSSITLAAGSGETFTVDFGASIRTGT